MLTIKRYSNRKFYDTQAKQYITLQGIAERIRRGQDVRVIDHTSGEDLTTLVLTQIVLEQEKKGTGAVPRTVLTGLVQAGELTLNRMRQALANPIDRLRQVDEEIERRIDALVQRGELAEEEARSLRQKLIEPDQSAFISPELAEEALHRLLEEGDLPSRRDLQTLAEQIDRLSAQLENIQNVK
jgi:polyhydroxyalkanoate synthesis repressor PhaR